MTFKIGFAAESPMITPAAPAEFVPQATAEPRKSVVQVYFPARNMTLAYYNDRFDLRPGDIVYVDGKLEGLQGRVKSVSYNFKIKLSDYKRVIAVADTAVQGQFFLADSHVLTFEPGTLPAKKVLSWFKAPAEEEEFVSGSDDTAFPLDDLHGMDITPAIAERGHNYYAENRVRYLSIDGAKGYAIVEGTEAYTVEFEYRNGEISRLLCSCYCSGNCKHEFAAMLQLRDLLDTVETHYRDEFARTGYFAAVDKGVLFSYTVGRKEAGSFTMNVV